MQFLEVSGAVRLIFRSIGGKGLMCTLEKEIGGRELDWAGWCYGPVNKERKRFILARKFRTQSLSLEQFYWKWACVTK